MKPENHFEIYFGFRNESIFDHLHFTDGDNLSNYIDTATLLVVTYPKGEWFFEVSDRKYRLASLDINTKNWSNWVEIENYLKDTCKKHNWRIKND